MCELGPRVQTGRLDVLGWALLCPILEMMKKKMLETWGEENPRGDPVIMASRLGLLTWISRTSLEFFSGPTYLDRFWVGANSVFQIQTLAACASPVRIWTFSATRPIHLNDYVVMCNGFATHDPFGEWSNCWFLFFALGLATSRRNDVRGSILALERSPYCDQKMMKLNKLNSRLLELIAGPLSNAAKDELPSTGTCLL